jgi:hypothetical protein
MNNTIPFSAKFKTIQTIYGAFIVAILAFSVVFYMSADNPVYIADMNDIFMTIVPIFSLVGIFVSNYIFKQLLSKIAVTDSLDEKFAKYQSATLVKGALLEAPALFAIVAVVVSNNLVYFVFTAVLVLLMYLRFPKLSKFEVEVPLTKDEKTEIHNR